MLKTIICLSVILGCSVLAQSQLLINYQGRVDSDEEVTKIEFLLLDADASGAGVLYSETHTGFTVANNVFNLSYG